MERGKSLFLSSQWHNSGERALKETGGQTIRGEPRFTASNCSFSLAHTAISSDPARWHRKSILIFCILFVHFKGKIFYFSWITHLPVVRASIETRGYVFSRIIGHTHTGFLIFLNISEINWPRPNTNCEHNPSEGVEQKGNGILFITKLTEWAWQLNSQCKCLFLLSNQIYLLSEKEDHVFFKPWFWTTAEKVSDFLLFAL